MNYTDMETEEKDRQALGTFKKLLGLEHFGWKFGAIMSLIGMIVFIISAVIMLIVGITATAASNNQADSIAPLYTLIVMGIVYFILSFVVFLPIVIINFKMIKKVEYYQSTIDTDINIARKRCTSVGMMVFCILFNNIAAIFFIINFVKTKANAESFDRMEARQKA